MNNFDGMIRKGGSMRKNITPVTFALYKLKKIFFPFGVFYNWHIDASHEKARLKRYKFNKLVSWLYKLLNAINIIIAQNYLAEVNLHL